MDENSLLQKSIEALYAEFSRYSSWNSQTICSCCLSAEDVRALLTRNLRKLSHEDLRKYAESILLTIGDVNDFRHFLPRLLELSTIPSKGNQWPSATIFAALDIGSWRSWPELEQRAINDFMRNWWLLTLSSYPSPISVTTILRALAAIYQNVVPFLDVWRESDSLCAFLQFLENQSLLEQTDSGFHDDHIQQFQDWLLSTYTVVSNLKQKVFRGILGERDSADNCGSQLINSCPSLAIKPLEVFPCKPPGFTGAVALPQFL